MTRSTDDDDDFVVLLWQVVRRQCHQGVEAARSAEGIAQHLFGVCAFAASTSCVTRVLHAAGARLRRVVILFQHLTSYRGRPGQPRTRPSNTLLSLLAHAFFCLDYAWELCRSGHAAAAVSFTWLLGSACTRSLFGQRSGRAVAVPPPCARVLAVMRVLGVHAHHCGVHRRMNDVDA